MENRIQDVQLQIQKLLPTEAEIWVLTDLLREEPGLDIRGRLIGPKCPGLQTIELAYPLQKFSKAPRELGDLARRVVIPEPNLWEPEIPFTYDAVVELWKGHCCLDQKPFTGIRLTKEKK